MTAKNKLYLMILLMLALLTACGFAVWYVFGLVVVESGKITGLQAEQQAIDRQKGRLGEMTKDYDSVKYLAPQLESVLLDSNEKLKFIMLVEQLSAQAGVDHVIEAVAGGSATAKSAAAEPIIFNINVTGDFPNVLKFIYALESAPYYLSVERAQLTGDGVKFSVGPSGSGAGGVRGQMLVKVYSR